MKNFKLILITFLLGVSVFCVYKYLLIIKEKQILSAELKNSQGQITVLKNENQGLLQELEKEKDINQEMIQKYAFLRRNFKAGIIKINQLNSELALAVKHIDSLNSEVSVLKNENLQMKEASGNLKIDLFYISQEKDDISRRMSSIAELKKAIRELSRQQKKGVKAVKEKPKKPIPAILEGNHGFLIKDGKPVPPVKIRIEVNPALQN